MMNMPDWAKYVLLGLGVVLVAFMFFWLGRILSRAGRVDDSESDPVAESNSEAMWGSGQESNDWSQN
jgi:hypothetical protein